ncbi:MAG: FtsX-like permease family protein [Rhodanobacter sp.]|jgi:putative ABC transport system permease protein|nr:FtsX-like permease family protein [Rhodanobacter sp.]
MYLSFFAKLILLNVVRDWRKNMIACVAIVIGTISLILFGGYIAQIYEGIRLGSIYSQLGHYQIFSTVQAKESYAKSLLDAGTTTRIEDTLKSLDEVRLVTRRIEAQGLVSFGNKSVGVLIFGVEADKDAEISNAVKVVQGTGLFAGNQSGALVGRELMGELGAKLGDALTILVTTSEGAINAVDVKVTGVMDTGAKELNKRFIKINLPLMQETLLSDAVTNLVVLLDEDRQTPQTDTRIRAAAASVGGGVEVKSWSDMSDQYHQIVTMFDNIFGFVTVLVVIIIFAAIFNTMTMAVMERVSELSTIRALGASRGNLLVMVMSEGLVVGILAVILGVACGAGIALLINLANIKMPTPPGSTFSYPLRILLNNNILLLPAALSLVATVVGGFFPAYRAGKLPINEAMQR